MSIGGQILRGTAWVSAASVLTRLGTFISNLLVIRFLGIEQVGQLGLIESWLTLAVIVALFGVSVASTKYVAQYLTTDAKRVGSMAGAALLITTINGLLVGVVMGVAALAFGQSPSGLFATAGTVLAQHALIFGVLVLITVCRHTVTSLVYGVQAYQFFVFSNLVIGLLSIPVLLLMALAGGLGGVLTAKVILALVETALLFMPVRRRLREAGARLSLRYVRRDGQQLLRFGLPTLVGQLATSPVQTFLLSVLAVQPGGLVQVGLLTTANRLVSLANFLPASMAPTLIPILSNEMGQGGVSRLSQSVALAIRMLWSTSLPVALFFSAAAPTLLLGLYGAEYAVAWELSFIFLATAIFQSINEPADRALAAADRQWLSTTNNLVWMGLFLTFGTLIIPRYLALGYAEAFLASYFLYVWVQLGWLNRLLGLRLRPISHLMLVSVALLSVAWVIAQLSEPLLQLGAAVLLAALALLLEWRCFLVTRERAKLKQYAQRAWQSGRFRLGLVKNSPD